MSGLILKDLLYLKKTAKVLVVLAAFYVILFLSTGAEDGGSGLLAGVVVMLTVILSINAFAYDELAKWRLYEGSLPVSRNRAVLARYLLALIFATGLALVSAVLELFTAHGVTPEGIMVPLESWSAALLICAVLFPAIYKFGTQKARFLLMLVFLIPTLGAILLKNLNLPVPDEADLEVWLNLFPLLAAAAYLFSLWLSCRIFRKKED